MSAFTASRLTAATLLTGVLGLAGCTETGLGLPGTEFDYDTTVEASNLINALDDRLDASSPTPAAQVPVTGTANYTGMSYMNDLNTATSNLNDPVFYYGQVSVQAAFDGAGSVTGVADNFIDGNNTFVDGQLTFTSNAIGSGTSGEFDAVVAGSITPATGGTQNFTGLVLESGFAGPNAEFVAGSGTDTLIINQGGTTQSVPFTFGYIAEQ